MSQKLILDLGCNIKCTAKYSLVNSKNPTVILSNGYGTTSFDNPVAQSLIQLLEKIDFNWIYYRYPEREPNPVSESLYISSGLYTLRIIYDWLIKRGFKRVGLFGISFGANISIELSLLENIEFLIIVNPVIDYVVFREKQIGSKLLKQWQENAQIVLQYDDGQVECYYRFIEEAQHQRLSERISKVKAITLVFQAELDELIDWKASQIVFFKIHRCKFLLVPNTEHSFKKSTSIEFFKISTLHFLEHEIMEVQIEQ